ncbi:Histidine kinase, HAMP region:Cache:Bacterial chemotaxis sensory transducer [Pseudomonas syringae pv. apii]|uniref:Histidine kinase, HAMP region:Cache:Bacterial chemotaxis sensory transducer n=2 Tax=Pseudomonas syringae group genomosp. 3 TaxID=251701 RepID=A0A3M5WEG4_9PSED|nr:methyl-accepting chemotaxis protein [Pseudomonas syringae group genomosp. 3]RMU68812.1 Histidine kinase, HAMP region:Cache:Bacterial chemotaxis sensory transducer [Pseudomonas syringae pv. apii]
MRKSLKFSHKILLAASLVVIAAFTLFTFYNDYLQRNALHVQLKENLNQTSESTAGNIRNWLSGRILLVENLAENASSPQSPQEQNRVLGQPTLIATFMSIYQGRSDGSFVTQPPDDMSADYDPRTRPWYVDALRAGKTILTEPYLDAVTKGLVVTLATPIKGDSGVSGVIGGDLSLEILVKMISSLRLHGDGYAFLVDANGRILVHPDTSLVMKTLAEVYPANTPRLSQDLSESEYAGKTQILTFAHVDGLPSVNWYVGVAMDKDIAYAALGEFRNSAIVATVIAVVLIILLLGMLLSVLLRPLNLMGRAMHDIAAGEGDLTKRLVIESQDEFGHLGNGFNLFVERIHDSMREVASSTVQLNEVALRVLNASNSSMLNSDQQSHRTNSVAAAINELGAATQEIAQNAARASGHSSDARTLASDGQDVVGQNIEALSRLSKRISSASGQIETLNTKTANIGQILDVITGISQQTNLLALNAAIEAARAGEAGRGFAVVADEVRSLAHRTQESASQVQEMIEQLQSGAREAVSIMNDSQRESVETVGIANKAVASLEHVTERIGEIDGMNQSVAAATEEQTAVVEAINVDITEINTLNQQGVENLNATLRACTDLEQQSTRLTQLVGSFRI